jgi:hypothetical protein
MCFGGAPSIPAPPPLPPAPAPAPSLPDAGVQKAKSNQRKIAAALAANQNIATGTPLGLAGTPAETASKTLLGV